MRVRLFLLLGGLFLAAGSWAAPMLSVGSTTGSAGTTVSLPIQFDPTTASVVGLQFMLTLPAGLSVAGTNTTGSVLTTPKKMIATNGTVTSSTFMVVGFFDSSFQGSCTNNTTSCGNLNTIGSGRLMNVLLNVAPGTPTGTLPVGITRVVYADNTNTSTAGTQSITPGTSTAGSVIISQFSPCDVNLTGGLPNVGDAIYEVNGVLDQTNKCIMPAMDLNSLNACDVGDVIRIVNAVLGGACVVGP